jgi:hypothetical protein
VVTERLPGEGGPSAPAALLEFVAECVRVTDGATGLTAAAAAVAALAVRHLPADLAGISMQDRHGEPQRLAASQDALLRLDREERGQQLTDAPRGTPLTVGDVRTGHDTATDTQWPEWSSLARALGIGSVLLLGLAPIRGRAVVLELYAGAPDRFHVLDSVALRQIATFVGFSLRQADQRSNLELALHSRGVIGQAQGILMERYELTGEQAMNYLRRHSQDSQIPIRDLAAGIVDDRELEAREHHQ